MEQGRRWRDTRNTGKRHWALKQVAKKCKCVRREWEGENRGREEGGGGVGRVCVRGWRTSCNICPCTPELTSPPHSPPNTNYDLQAFTFVHFRINARITVGHAEDKVFLNNNCCIYYKALGDFTSSIKSIKISILPSLHTAPPPSPQLHTI